MIPADRLELSLDEILARLHTGESAGQIAAASGHGVGELRRELSPFPSELARSITNPPTRECCATS